jgi:hypothetical protein
VFAFGAMMVSSASAALTFELAQWLVASSRVAAELLVVSEGELTLKNTATGTQVRCSGLFVGTIGPESLDLTTEVLNLAGEKVTELNGLAVVCTGEGTCVKEADAEAWPLKLPWLTEVELDVETGLFYELTFGAAYHVLCLVLGISVEKECSAAEGAEVEVLNKVGGVEANGKQSPNGPCGEEKEVGEVNFLAGNLTSSTEGIVSVSE